MSFHTGSRRSQPPLALAVPLSRFTSRVGGGSAFYVRQYGPPDSSNTRRASEDSEGDTCGAVHELVCDANIRTHLGVLHICRDDCGLVCGRSNSHSFLGHTFHNCWSLPSAVSSLRSGLVGWHGR